MLTIFPSGWLIVIRDSTKRLTSNAFWLSVLLHITLLLLMILTLHPPKETKKPPHMYVPAYTYSGAVAPQRLATAQATKRHDMSPQEMREPAKQEVAAKHGILPKSMLLASYNMLQQEQRQSFSTVKDDEPIYLIGDTSSAADPLVRLLGKALSAHFRYPPAAGELGIRGKTLVGMTLHPEGEFSNVQVIESSQHDELDAAALYAVNTAPMIKEAQRYISKPKRFMVYFIFR